MTRAEKRQKTVWFILMLAYFGLGYMLINRIMQGRAHFFDVSMGFESAIPFVPEFIFGYCLVFLSVFLAYLVIDDMDVWMRGIRAFAIATTLAYIFYLAFPVRMDLRPAFVEGHGFVAWATGTYFKVDLPYNCLPSLHVTYPALVTMLVWPCHSRLRWLFLAMALTVSVSVILVKQHYIADVIAGIANASLCYWLAIAYERYTLVRRERSLVAAQ